MKKPMCVRLVPLLGALLLALAACSPATGTTAALPTPAADTPTPPPPTETLIPPPPGMAVVASPMLTYIDFQDYRNGWGIAVNDNGYILRSVDSGRTWWNASPPGLTQVGYSTSMSVLDPDAVWVLVPNADMLTGVLFRTVDGGLNWSSNPVPFGWAMLQFLDAGTGRAMAGRGMAAGSEAVELYQTSDGGATWTSVFRNDPSQTGASDSLPLSGIKDGMTFLDASTGWVTGTRPISGDMYVFVTHDGGVSWTQQSVPGQAGFENLQYMPSAPVFFGEQGFLPMIIYAPDGNTERFFYTTRDGGATWSGDPTVPNSAITPPGSYAFADAAHGWCWDGGASLYVTTDGARTWSGIASFPDLSGRLAQLEFASGPGNDFTGWALTGVDESGRSQLYLTTDRGTNWIPLIP